MATAFDPRKPDVKDGPAPQATNPDAQNTSKGVTPGPLKSDPNQVSEVRNAAGQDPDSLIRAAKHQAAAADDLVSEEDAVASIERAREARELISRRNLATSPAEVEKIDGELKGLGFDLPLSVPPAAQRRDAGPVGRRSPSTSKA